MYFDRPEAKRRAKASVRGAYPHPALVTLIYVLLTTILTGVIMIFVNNPFQAAYLYLLDGYYAPELIFRTIFTPGRVTIYVVLNLLISLYTMVMAFGYSSYGLRLSRWEQPGFRNLFDGFALLGRVIGMNILIAVFSALWSLLGVVPYAVLMILGIFFEAIPLVVLSIIALIAGIIFAVAMVYRYSLAFYFLLDHPADMGVLECIRQSKRAMKGRRWSLFVLQLSFLGWGLLSLLTLGILGLWVSPYMAASQANFYNWAVYGRFPDPPAPPVNETSPGF